MTKDRKQRAKGKGSEKSMRAEGDFGHRSSILGPYQLKGSLTADPGPLGPSIAERDERMSPGSESPRLKSGRLLRGEGVLHPEASNNNIAATINERFGFNGRVLPNQRLRDRGSGGPAENGRPARCHREQPGRSSSNSPGDRPGRERRGHRQGRRPRRAW